MHASQTLDSYISTEHGGVIPNKLSPPTIHAKIRHTDLSEGSNIGALDQKA
jgi:hypothetical protein